VTVGLNALARAEHACGDHAAAESHYAEALEIAKKFNRRQSVAIYTGNLAVLALTRQDWPAAEKLAREALPLAEAVGRLELIGSACARLALALTRLDRPREALPLARRADEIFSRLRLTENLKTVKAILKECDGARGASDQEF
jgi:tetratricopeptide (TPR) repeat protein